MAADVLFRESARKSRNGGHWFAPFNVQFTGGLPFNDPRFWSFKSGNGGNSPRRFSLCAFQSGPPPPVPFGTGRLRVETPNPDGDAWFSAKLTDTGSLLPGNCRPWKNLTGAGCDESHRGSTEVPRSMTREKAVGHDRNLSFG